jgi:ADP-ribose pyrophosphatase YjhB (NUDIX family)
VYPGWWDLAFGGVCAVGEGWESSARRELAEEAGLEADLVDLGPVRYDSDDGRVVGRVFLARHDGPPRCDDGEVVETAWVPRPSLEAWAGDRQVCRDSQAVVLPLVLALR